VEGTKKKSEPLTSPQGQAVAGKKFFNKGNLCLEGKRKNQEGEKIETLSKFWGGKTFLEDFHCVLLGGGSKRGKKGWKRPVCKNTWLPQKRNQGLGIVWECFQKNYSIANTSKGKQGKPSAA